MYEFVTYTVADPGFDLSGGVDFLNGGGGRKALKVLTVEEKAILACFCQCSIKIRLNVNRERRKNKKI